MVSQEQILKALSQVIDPDLGKDLVSLNMIEDLKIEGNTVCFSINLTTPACPLKDHIKNACITAIHTLVDKNIEIEINLISRRKEVQEKSENMLPQVKEIIAVMSGKGGVGKSTVAVNFALSLSKLGAKVGLLDADIFGPSIPTMLGIQEKHPQIVDIEGKKVIIPIEKFNLFIMSIGLLVEPNQALVWRGPMAGNAFKQLIIDVEWGELDYLVIDMPPGTSDIHLTLLQTLKITGSLIVTTPQEVALVDVRKAINMLSNPKLMTNIIGVVENMSYFTPAELPDNKYFIFGQDGAKKLCEETGFLLLGKIPLVQSVCEGGDQGLPIVAQPENPAGEVFLKMTENIVRLMAKRNA
ncbi:MAG: Mrp/NBP35 family ATP-binding protein [Chitinophagaceae bacterium]